MVNREVEPIPVLAGHSNPSHDGIDRLHRFGRVDESQIEYLRALLVHGKLYHSLPSQFNDPFECTPHWSPPTTEAEEKEIRRHFSALLRVQNPGLSRPVSRRMVAAAMADKPFFHKSMRDAISATYSEIRICCFTANKDNLLMWSHYADAHRGFCLEFDARAEPFLRAHKVAYSTAYPVMPYPVRANGDALIPALTKSKEWEYEQEYRSFLSSELENAPRNDGSSCLLDGAALKAVYFGARMTPKHRGVVTSLIREGLFRPDFWEAKISENAFELTFQAV